MNEEAPKTSATEDDVKAGRAVFHVPGGRSQAFDLGCPLPVKAIVREGIDAGDSGASVTKGSIVEIVQVELIDGTDVLVGFRIGADEGVCMIDELEVIK